MGMVGKKYKLINKIACTCVDCEHFSKENWFTIEKNDGGYFLIDKMGKRSLSTYNTREFEEVKLVLIDISDIERLLND